MDLCVVTLNDSYYIYYHNSAQHERGKKEEKIYISSGFKVLQNNIVYIESPHDPDPSPKLEHDHGPAPAKEKRQGRLMFGAQDIKYRLDSEEGKRTKSKTRPGVKQLDKAAQRAQSGALGSWKEKEGATQNTDLVTATTPRY